MSRYVVPRLLLLFTLCTNIVTLTLLIRLTFTNSTSVTLTGSLGVQESGIPTESQGKTGESKTDLDPADREFVKDQKYRDLAIVVPYRKRPFQLRVFISYMNHYLSLQNISYHHFYIIEQADDGLFNRAKLLNIGFTEALKAHAHNCVVFHDVDLLPEVPEMAYGCHDHPVHMSVAVDTLNYTLPYEKIFGGVSSMTPEWFKKINGFSNIYWGWGGEDDDMFKRLSAANAMIDRPSHALGRFTMLKGSHTTAFRSNSR